ERLGQFPIVGPVAEVGVDGIHGDRPHPHQHFGRLWLGNRKVAVCHHVFRGARSFNVGSFDASKSVFKQRTIKSKRPVASRRPATPHRRKGSKELYWIYVSTASSWHSRCDWLVPRTQPTFAAAQAKRNRSVTQHGGRAWQRTTHQWTAPSAPSPPDKD